MTGWCMVLVSRCRGDKGRSQKGHCAAADGEMRAGGDLGGDRSEFWGAPSLKLHFAHIQIVFI